MLSGEETRGPLVVSNMWLRTAATIVSFMTVAEFFVGVQGFFDPTLTIVSRWGRLDDYDNSTITCLSTRSAVENLNFDRVLNTGQESKLPQNNIILLQHDPEESKTLYLLPSNDDKDRRFGAFSCYVTNSNITTRVVTLKQPSPGAAEIIPRYAYKRASIDSSATIQMVRMKSQPGYRLIWRHKGDKQTNNMDSLSFYLPKVKLQDGGIYELFYEQRRKFGVHGIMRLIIRDCPPDRYGPMCELTCPPCINGGICHERYGVCICPPGFTGIHCERPCGWNRFGPNCAWKCNSDEVEGCSRALICLPDPYGCSCASGLYEIDCIHRCPPGKFGADCSQICRCRNNTVPCDSVTGMCLGECQEGYKGITCQQTSLGPVQNLEVESGFSPDEMKVTWLEPRVSHGVSTYIVTWHLIQQKACKTISTHDTHKMTVYTKSAVLRGLLPYSIYEVTVYASNPRMTGEPTSRPFTTDEKTPTEKLVNLSVSFVGPSELDFAWDPLHCTSINGHLLAYESELSLLSSESPLGSKNKHKMAYMPHRMESVDTYVKFSNLMPYSNYQFRVRAMTANGEGPWSDTITAYTRHSEPPVPTLHLLESTARTLTVGVNSASLPPGVIQQVTLRAWEERWEEATLNNNIPVTPPITAHFNASLSSTFHNYTFTRLHPFTYYLIQGRILTNNGWSNWSSFLRSQTDESYPAVPLVSFLDSTTDSLALRISRPSPTNGAITQYRLRVAGSRMPGNTPSMPIINTPEDSPILDYTVRDLLPATRYQVQVQASTSVGWGNWSEPLDCWTQEGSPGAPRSLILLSNNESSLLIQWNIPQVTNGKLINYEVAYNPISSLYSDLVTWNSSVSLDVDSSINSVLLDGLHPLTYYRIRVRGRTLQHVGEVTEKVFMTGIKVPHPPVVYTKRATDTAIPVRIELLPIEHNFTSHYQIIVEDRENSELIDEKRLLNFTTSKEEQIGYYVALEVNNRDIPEKGLLLYVGDDNIYKEFWNAPLQPEKIYFFRLRILVFTDAGTRTAISLRTAESLEVKTFHAARMMKSDCRFYEPGCVWFPFIVIGCAIFVIWVIAAIVIYKCMAKKNTDKKKILERGSSTSIAWSVAYRKGCGSSSEASTLVKDQSV